MAKTFKLALNAGHGMHTEGKRCMKSLDPSETREWWLNQRVANYVQEAAKQYDGFGVLRTDDTTGAEDVRLSNAPESVFRLAWNTPATISPER